jgi:hypothetical protein
MYVHVVTSVVTTGVIVWALATIENLDSRDRYIAAVGITVVILGSALGFSVHTRPDRPVRGHRLRDARVRGRCGGVGGPT